MRLPGPLLAALAVTVLATAGCPDRTPRGTATSVGAESAVHTAFRGPLHGRLVIRPPSPTVGQVVRFELEGWDERGGELLLSASYDGHRPEDEGAAPPEHCPAPEAGPAAQAESRQALIDERAFDRAGTYDIAFLVLSLRCDESRAEIQVKATLDVRPA